MANKTNTTTTKAGFTPRKDDKSILQQGQRVTGIYCGIAYTGTLNEHSRPTPGGYHMIYSITLDTPITVFGQERQRIEIWTNGNDTIGKYDTVFCIEASRKNPETLQSFDRDNLIDTAKTIVRKEARTQALYFLRRGYWVEIFNDCTKELIAGPFDPDQPEPSYIF